MPRGIDISSVSPMCQQDFHRKHDFTSLLEIHTTHPRRAFSCAGTHTTHLKAIMKRFLVKNATASASQGVNMVKSQDNGIFRQLAALLFDVLAVKAKLCDIRRGNPLSIYIYGQYSMPKLFDDCLSSKAENRTVTRAGFR